eukprot:CAMPEP_0118941506 /NCGR_PEP_ID=MMETSP1169-20130426/34025_1 /TAXON_ID=36882 /ORGANISM="Pyramimonas obovata, Strain CCMP722" /LENGTH=112 /DNA_ID=CAMNT_0006886275 /DNA_START=229 /DNA_END=564 /DNA_ORIENTATION=+
MEDFTQTRTGPCPNLGERLEKIANAQKQLSSLQTGAQRLMQIFSKPPETNEFNKVLAEVLTENDTALKALQTDYQWVLDQGLLRQLEPSERENRRKAKACRGALARATAAAD